MGVTNYSSASNFVERDSYLPEGWSKQVCSDLEGNGYISYMSPNGDTFRSRKAVDEYLATLDEPANNELDQPLESENVSRIETDVEDNAISQDTNELSLEFDSDDDSDDEVDDNQCNICGKIFDEDKGLILHVEDVHKDYYFDEDNSLLLKEDMVSKENSVSKCKLCLENFKNEDLQLHMKGLHPSDYEENERNAIHDVSEQNGETGKTLKNDDKQEIDIETDKIEGTDEKQSLEANDSIDMDDDELDDNQCNICGKMFEEDKSLILHVEEIHKDYYFDQDNSLLLKEDFLAKENTVSKCQLCLENFKTEDLHQHMKGMHPTDYEETEIKANREANHITDKIEQTDEKQSFLGKDKVYKPNQTQNEKLVNNIIDDDENKNRGETIFTEQETSQNHIFTDEPLKTFTAQAPIKTEPNLEPRPSNIPTTSSKKQTASGREAPYKCNLCDIKYYVRSHLQVHNERMHKKCKWKCEVCLTVHASEAELKEHNSTSQHEYRTRTLMASQIHQQPIKDQHPLKRPPTDYQLNQNAYSTFNRQPHQSAQSLLNQPPNQTVQSLSNQQPNQNVQPLSNPQPNQNGQSPLNKPSNQNSQFPSNKQQNQNPQYFPTQWKGVPPPQRNWQQAANVRTSSTKLNPDKWNPQGDISQINSDKWNPRGNLVTQINKEYNPPQYVPQPRSKTYGPQDIKPDIKPIVSQPPVTQEVKPAPPPSPPRPMDPVTKMHLTKVTKICQDLNLFDYPVPVNPRAKQFFKDPHTFGAYLLPLLMSVNPSSKMQDLAILGKAKWSQLLESQTGAMEPPVGSNGRASVVNTAGLCTHMQHLQILQSIGAQ